MQLIGWIQLCGPARGHDGLTEGIKSNEKESLLSSVVPPDKRFMSYELSRGGNAGAGKSVINKNGKST